MKEERSKKFKIVLIIAAAIMATVAIMYILPFGLLFYSVVSAKEEVYDDISTYSEYMTFDKSAAKWTKWGMDETIWPKMIMDDMKVADFKMVYYNPWDAQYLGYLVVDYPAEAYEAEIKRLKEYPSTDYIGYYSVKEEKTYDLLAVNADEYQGFVYALTDGKGRIIYAEEIFCNYMMDLDYDKYIPKEYLLDGFDATEGNTYKKEKLKK